MSDDPGLLLLAHGSPDRRHTETIASITAAVGRAVDVPVGHAFLDHHAPDASAAVSGLVARGVRSVVVVPLLLGAAFHRAVDVPAAVAAAAVRFPGLRTAVTDVLAPDARLADAVQRRLVEAGAAESAPVVLAHSGTRGEMALAQIAAVGEALARRRGGPVSVAAPDDVVVAVDALGSSGTAPVVAPFLLAPGVIGDRISDAARSAGVDAAAPIGAAPELVDLVVARWVGARQDRPSSAA